MLLGKKFEAYMEASPVSVIIRGTLERLLKPETLEKLFQEHALTQYTLKITFAHCVEIMNAVVFKTQPSLAAWFQLHGEKLEATRQAMYEKIQNIEIPVSAALVHYSGQEILKFASRMPNASKNPLPGFRTRVIDGNHLTGTEHRPIELRGTRAAALPGQALALFDLQYKVITDVIPCEDAYTQERALLDQALTRISGMDCLIGDRNFCTTKFLFGIDQKNACFIIRQHAANVKWEPIGKARKASRDGLERQLMEQRVRLIDPNTGKTMEARRITIPLRQPEAEGEKFLYLLTNLPKEKAATRLVTELYADRWTIETAFQQLTQDLRTEIDTLAYPKAALFGFCLACVAFNAVALVKAALWATLGEEFVTQKLSMYYLTLEIAQVARGMEIALPAEDWHIFGRMSPEEFMATILDLASRIQAKRFTKHKRGPKKPPPEKKSGKRVKHMSNARALAGAC